MQKIKSITLRNFKYFYGKETEQPQNKIELDKQNLLLYGENGSGKSSIYWALYTFLQSSIKDLNGSWYLSNPNCHFLTKQNITQNTAKVALGNTIKLGQGYGNIRFSLGIKTNEADNIKDLKEIIFKDGLKLIDKLNA